ncbi:DUF1109 domain-containing protein [Paraburkholderia caribensis]|uniref:DUF1109 domain-containing protein n=1 Tax=Paraburkholderia caribensis TaxID=75105 RepID=UPI001D0899B8|nr:DUF1109 domain-containing protein [Paraburkholderia caribensis]MDR6380771.1 hypothetical protein [Paraburkholderia caribensis]
MKTDTLISLLVSDLDPVDQVVPWSRFWPSIAYAVGASCILMVLLYGLHPDLEEMLFAPVFWAKLALPVSLAGIVAMVTMRLSYPGVPIGVPAVCWMLPILCVACWGAYLLVNTSTGERASLILGRTWRTCSLNITLLSIPAFIAITRTLRSLAPTRLRIAGAAAGLLSGALGATVYCAHCPEMSPVFWATWYVPGMCVPAVAGALLGPRLLRW